jgi:hypothetical protein
VLGGFTADLDGQRATFALAAIRGLLHGVLGHVELGDNRVIASECADVEPIYRARRLDVGDSEWAGGLGDGLTGHN